MRITIQSSHDCCTELETDEELRRALISYTMFSFERAAEADVSDASAAIILARETDAPEALAALKQAGIRALAS